MSQVTLATINVSSRYHRWLRRRQLLVGQLVDSAPDIVCLQSLNYPIGQGRWLLSQINARLKSREQPPYRLVQPRPPFITTFGNNMSVGVLTRLPVVYHDTLSLGAGSLPALRVNVRLPNQHTLDVVSVHLRSGEHDVQMRQEQVLLLTGWLNDQKWVPRQVVAGDFNEVPSGLAIQLMKQRFRSAYSMTYGREPLATYPTRLLDPLSVSRNGRFGWSGCLDYIFVSSGVPGVKKTAVFLDKHDEEDDTLYPSDHVGLLATLLV